MRDPLTPRAIDPKKPRTCYVPLAVGTCGKPAEDNAPIAACLPHLAEAWTYCQDKIEREKRELMPAAFDARSRRIANDLLACGAEARKDRAQLATDPEVDDPDSVVYYLKFADRVKIGFSRNLGSRLLAIPHDELLAVEPGAREVERRRHEQFAPHRIKGEWFTLNDKIRAHIDVLKAQHAARHKVRDRARADALNDYSLFPSLPKTERQMLGLNDEAA